jgi:6-phosphogluconolactonase
MEEETAPRHIAFTASGNIAYMTCELSSEIVALHFDFNAQQINIIDRMSTVGPDFVGLNEPAEIRIHPGGEFVYVNNRGEDTLVWFHIDEFSNLTRKGEILLEKSLHPGVAARSFTITANGDYLFVADRPANSVRSYKINQHSGFLTIVSEINVSQPAYVEILPC